MTKRGHNRLRIIGGEWRGRKLSFPAVPELRPTPERVRETLFNWLRDIVPGARCLDLFAGSGALALEALSRGAEEVVMVDSHPAVVAQLREHLLQLKARHGRVVLADAELFLRGPSRPFDIVFLDPPFDCALLGPCAARLAAGGWLAATAWLYVESDRRTPLPPLPAAWKLLRHKEAGQVGYYLLQSTSIRNTPGEPS
ncbi:MAG: 16S rRNA (guanine(966)-N(2))-methyltransferase RsmD [Gammaproteobacteria bacterium]